MKIQILQGIEGAGQARGLAVVIDVFRAFSLECYLIAAGAERILPVGAKETAYRLKEENPDYVLIGERKGVILPGFDYGNSPSQTEGMDLKGKTLVHTTSAGTQGIVAAYAGADEVITGSLVNAKAVADYIRSKAPEYVSIVCMGTNGLEEAPEDTLCGLYIKAILEGEKIDLSEGLAGIRNHREGKKFFDPETQQIFPMKDYAMCTMIDRFDMVLRVTKVEDDIFETRRIL